MPPIAIAALLLAAGIALRLVPVRLYRREPTDAAAQAYFASLIRSHRRVPRWVDRIEPRTEGSYPAGIAWWLAWRRPVDPVRSCARLNVAVQALEACVAIAAGEVVARSLGLDPWSISPWIAAAFLAPPLTFLPWAGVYSVTARPIGALCSNAILAALLLGTAVDWRWHLAAAALVPVSVAFSQFASQGVLLGAIALCVGMPSWQPAATVLLATAAAIAGTGGYAWFVLRGHWAHSSYYARVLQYQHVATTVRFTRRREVVAGLMRGRVPRPDILVQDPVLRALVAFPLYPIGALGPLLVPGLLDEPLGRGLWSLCVAAAAAIPVFSYRHLRFLGEPDRYIMFCATLASAVIAGRWASSSQAGTWTCIGVVALSVLLSAAAIWAQSRKRGEGWQSDDAEVGRRIDAAAESGSVLVNPASSAYRFIPHSGRTFLTLFMNVPRDREGQQVLVRLFEAGYPFVRIDGARLAREFGVTTVVECKRYFREEYAARHGTGSSMLGSGRPAVYEDAEVAIYRVTPDG